ncbi:hypothetical protein [Clostridioides difficile]|uniref:hypothetical protein n=1 Tax=Clostridioides difficile TaxID=1496 RepID=UPI00295EC413|nr:hypothetical protein [Clostridioides difficile]
MPFDGFADPEKTVIGWLSEHLAGVTVRNETGTTLTPPLVRVTLSPGGGGDDLDAVASVDVECFGADRAAMWALAWRMHAAMLRLAGNASRGSHIDTVAVAAFPGYVEYGNPAVRRAIGTYELTSRAQTILPAR